MARQAYWFSPPHIQAACLRGHIFGKQANALLIRLEVDGQHVDNALAGLPMPEHERSSGTAASAYYFLLGPRIFDGRKHELKLTAHRANGHTVATTSMNFQADTPYGQVQRSQDNYAGWVAFHKQPPSLPELRITNPQGALLKRIQLFALPVVHADFAYHAQFDIPTNQIACDEPHFHCDGVELIGSPCRLLGKPIGLIEEITADGIRGWAFDANRPNAPVELRLRIDGHEILHFRPNYRRPDIAKYLGHADTSFGIAGFQLPIPHALLDGAEHRVDIEFAEQGTPLNKSGWPIRFPRPYLELNEIAPSPSPSIPRLKRRPLPRAPKVSVIVLNRNGETPLAALFASWERHNTLPDVEWIVIDHASQDGSLAMMETWHTRLPLRIVALPVNDSFSASCNRAAALARGEYLLFLNNDIIWLQDALPAMLDSLVNHPHIGAVGLKLLKAADDGSPLAQPQVQHLGVRFKLSGAAYWPYEATPSDVNDENEHGIQATPAVTAAVLLCRKQDFFAAGQFDTGYFYGFEDVEFCLRLRARLHKYIVCRNDLVALHRHGHTRLSGRATDIFDRLAHNADVLQRHVGLWLKRHLWRSWLTNDRDLAVEKFVVGFVIDAAGEQTSTALQASAMQKAQALLARHPSIRPVFLDPSRGWFDVRDIHLLIVGHPEYDLRRLRNRRADMLAVAWVQDEADTWVAMPWWHDFAIYLTESADIADRLQSKCPAPVHVATQAAPLGTWFAPDTPPLRIALCLPQKIPPRGSSVRSLIERCESELRASGAIVWRLSPADWNNETRLVDIRIFPLQDTPPAKFEIKPRPDTLDILWSTGKSVQKRKRPGTLHTKTMPQAAWLQQQLDKRIGNTFCTP